MMYHTGIPQINKACYDRAGDTYRTVVASVNGLVCFFAILFGNARKRGFFPRSPLLLVVVVCAAVGTQAR
jgi:hypothetical protein